MSQSPDSFLDMHLRSQTDSSQLDAMASHSPEPSRNSDEKDETPLQESSKTSPSKSGSPEPRRCWICFGEDDEDSGAAWVHPCRCTLVSHEQCLLEWINENQKDAPGKKVFCPQCSAPYVISGSGSLTLSVLTLIDTLVHSAAPYLTLLGLSCSILVTATTYGAYTVMTLMGPEEGEKLMGSPSSWSWRTWLSLPMIPVVLVSSRFRWADGFLPFAAVLFLRATGNPPHQLRISWPPTPAATLGLFPWVR